MPLKHNHQAARPLIIEMVGPAGSGKSTFTRALKKQVTDICVIEQPDYRQLKNAPFFLFNGLAMLPVFIDIMLHRQTRGLNRQAIATMILLHGWHRKLNREKKTDTLQAFFIDQGAVSFLTYLNYQGQCFPNSPLAVKWLDKTYDAWARSLDIVIHLDAPNEVLFERIRGRDQIHALQTAPYKEAAEELDIYRKLYDEIFARLKAKCSSMKVMYFESVNMTPDQLNRSILDAIEQEIQA